MLSERRTRLAADKKAKEAKEKANRTAERESRANPTSMDTSDPSKLTHAKLQKIRQQEAKAERARILKLVEDDKLARRERSIAARKNLVATKNDDTLLEPSEGGSKQVALQIRLFDGSSIRSRFDREENIRTTVRPFIDRETAGQVPYTFKHILSPLPNRDITISDEDLSLSELGLAPSATLILVPVNGFTNAYEDSYYMSVIIRPASLLFGAIGSGLAAARASLGSVWAQQEEPATSSSRTDSQCDEPQLYNGNAVSTKWAGPMIID